MADWGAPRNRLTRVAFLAVQELDGCDTTGDNVAGRSPRVVVEAGPEGAGPTARYLTVFGDLSSFTVRKPDNGSRGM